ncbi:hypothetical protein JHN63_04065 [Streptomyces sp. MBT65]|uniref:hypothetical protein n=1 Tax=Streptomyces sp. MBT65 TaxID=1488395 RepID=UPI00190C2D47|nr:hypothetical protein [Streptomyces sp. MBT65]MBK3573011.1 hypothetical protein [Streptomyces sp. MBT65]
MVRLLAPVLLAALVVTGCKKPADGLSGSFKPNFLPVTFTIDSSGRISVSADASIVTPLGEVSVSGFQQELGNPKPYLVAAIRHLVGGAAADQSAFVDRTTGPVHAAYAEYTDYTNYAEGGARSVNYTEAGARSVNYAEGSVSSVYSLYKIAAEGRSVQPALNGQPLALAKSGTIVVDATHTKPGSVTEVQIADTEDQDSPVPSGTASSCAGTDAIGITLPEVSAGAEVADTVAELTADCLQVQYAAEPADGVTEGTVARVVIPTEGSADPVRLPPVDEGAPGPGDHVTVSRRSPVTVYVAATAPSPSASSSTSPSPSSSSTDEPSGEPSETVVPGTALVEAAAYAPVRTAPGTTGEQASHIEPGAQYRAVCVTHGGSVQAHGYASDLWVELLLNAGGTGWVTATALTGGPDGLSLSECPGTGTDTLSPTPLDTTPTG